MTLSHSSQIMGFSLIKSDQNSQPVSQSNFFYSKMKTLGCISAFLVAAFLGCWGQEAIPLLNGGQPASRIQFPWQVQLTPSGINVNFSGILIDNEWVLTCAACANKANEYTLTFGAYDLNKPDEQGRETLVVNVENIILHPEYNPNKFNEKNIALIRLPVPLTLSAYVDKVNLPALGTNDTYEGWYARISGYGFMEDASEGRILRFTDVMVLGDGNCSRILEGQMCAKLNGVGPCEDEGSALTIVEQARSFAIGIFSYGFGEGSCPGTTTLFTRTTTYLDWIVSVANITIG